ncbi:MAG: DUF4224 domain-containing protein [Thiohalocapsa sp.]
MLFLTRQEICDLTGYKLPSYQRRWLNDRRWCYELGADGHPRVLRAHAMRQLDGVDSTTKHPQLRLPDAAA